MTPGLIEKIQAQQETHESEPVGRSDPKQIDEKLTPATEIKRNNFFIEDSNKITLGSRRSPPSP
jgi:hypothetical protein